MKRYEQFAADNWFALACVSLGFFFACSESDRFTTLTNVTNYPLYAVLFFFLSLIILAVCVLFLSRRSESGLDLASNIPLMIVVGACFVAKTAIQFTPLGTLFAPGTMGAMVKTLQVMELVAFIGCGEFLMRAGGRRSILAFGVALIIGGSAQLFIAVLSRVLAVALLFIISLLVTPLLFLAQLGFNRAQLPAADDAVDPIHRHTSEEAAANKTSYAGLLAMVFILPLIFGGIHTTWLPAQDGGTGSRIIQLSAALGTLLCGNIIVLLVDNIKDAPSLDLIKNLVLPVVIVALYFASLFPTSMTFAYVLPLNIAQKGTLFLAWAAPLFFHTERRPITMLCLGIITYNVGRGVRLLINSGLENSSFKGDLSTMIMAFSMLMLIVIAVFAYYNTRMATQKAVAKAQAEAPVVRRRFIDACKDLEQEAQMTAREGEVFILLAKGRGADYIGKKLMISVPTVRSHMAHIYQKLNVGSQQALMELVDLKMQEGDEAAAQ